MTTLLLLAAGALSFALFYKTVHYFEKIWNHARPIHCLDPGLRVHVLRACEAWKIL